MIADMAEEVLAEAGYDVIGIARTVDEGLALAVRHKPSLAVIDQRLACGGLGTSLAAQIAMDRSLQRVGILYATGNVASVKAIEVAGDACLAKPYRAADLVHALTLVAEIVDTGHATPPWPSGFSQIQARRPSPPDSPHG